MFVASLSFPSDHVLTHTSYAFLGGITYTLPLLIHIDFFIRQPIRPLFIHLPCPRNLTDCHRVTPLESAAILRAS